jgi:hypothetical protein
MLADDDGSRPRTLVLALLARRGDTRATEMLQRELDSERELFGGDYLRVAYAGYALAERGDATAWRRAIDALRPAFERDWSQRRFVDAAACVQLLRDFDRALTDGRPLPFETLMSKEVGAAYATAVDDPNVLRNDLDELARRR